MYSLSEKQLITGHQFTSPTQTHASNVNSLANTVKTAFDCLKAHKAGVISTTTNERILLSDQHRKKSESMKKFENVWCSALEECCKGIVDDFRRYCDQHQIKTSKKIYTSCLVELYCGESEEDIINYHKGYCSLDLLVQVAIGSLQSPKRNPLYLDINVFETGDFEIYCHVIDSNGKLRDNTIRRRNDINNLPTVLSLLEGVS